MTADGASSGPVAAAGPSLQTMAAARRPVDVENAELHYKWYVVTENRAELMLAFILVRGGAGMHAAENRRTSAHPGAHF